MKPLRALAAGFCASVLLQGAARANPWLKEDGDTEVITNLEASQQPTGLSGAAASASFDFHVEYGYDRRATLIADVDTQRYSSNAPGGPPFNNARIGGRTALARWDNSILSVEAVGGVMSVRNGIAPLPAASLYGTAEARLMFGEGFDILGRHGFAGIEGGWRWRPGPPADEAVIDAIIGYAPWRSGLLMLQSFSILGTGDASGGYSRYSLSKVAVSLAQRVTDHLSVQAGLLYQVAGREAGTPGVVLALWWRISPPALSPVIF